MTTARARLVDGGRIILPAPIRKAMGLETGDTVLLELNGDALTLRSANSALRRLQARARSFASDQSVTDELIAERRAEALRE